MQSANSEKIISDNKTNYYETDNHGNVLPVSNNHTLNKIVVNPNEQANVTNKLENEAFLNNKNLSLNKMKEPLHIKEHAGNHQPIGRQVNMLLNNNTNINDVKSIYDVERNIQPNVNFSTKDSGRLDLKQTDHTSEFLRSKQNSNLPISNEVNIHTNQIKNNHNINTNLPVDNLNNKYDVKYVDMSDKNDRNLEVTTEKNDLNVKLADNEYIKHSNINNNNNLNHYGYYDSNKYVEKKKDVSRHQVLSPKDSYDINDNQVYNGKPYIPEDNNYKYNDVNENLTKSYKNFTNNENNILINNNNVNNNDIIIKNTSSRLNNLNVEDNKSDYTNNYSNDNHNNYNYQYNIDNENLYKDLESKYLKNSEFYNNNDYSQEHNNNLNSYKTDVSIKSNSQSNFNVDNQSTNILENTSKNINNSNNNNQDYLVTVKHEEKELLDNKNSNIEIVKNTIVIEPLCDNKQDKEIKKVKLNEDDKEKCYTTHHDDNKKYILNKLSTITSNSKTALNEVALRLKKSLYSKLNTIKEYYNNRKLNRENNNVDMLESLKNIVSRIENEFKLKLLQLNEKRQEVLIDKLEKMAFNKINVINLLLLGTNNFCFDCNSENNSWVNITLGIFLCPICADKQRYEFSKYSHNRIKSIEFNDFTDYDFNMLYYGGNSRLREVMNLFGIDSSISNYKLKYLFKFIVMYVKDLNKIAKNRGLSTLNLNINMYRNNINDIEKFQDAISPVTYKDIERALGFVQMIKDRAYNFLNIRSTEDEKADAKMIEEKSNYNVNNIDTIIKEETL